MSSRVVVHDVDFSLDNPGFSASAEFDPATLQDSTALLPPTASGS